MSTPRIWSKRWVTASGETGAHIQAKELLATLADQYWNVAAGIHEGGLGGNGRPADPNQHITLSTGHHVQLGNNGAIKNITGNGITRKETGKRVLGQNEEEIAALQERHKLTEKQAVKVQQLHSRDGITIPRAVEQVIRNASKQPTRSTRPK